MSYPDEIATFIFKTAVLRNVEYWRQKAGVFTDIPFLWSNWWIQ